MSLFFQILVIKVDEKLQVFPDSGISDASDTGFEEAMDVSDGNCDLNFGPVLGNDLIRLYHLIILLTFYTQPSVCIFSILFSLSFPRC